MSAKKYILHGGATIGQEENAGFYRQMAKSLEQPKVLLVYFSRDSEDWPKLAENDEKNFLSANTDKKFKFVVANEKDFKNQILDSDVIYFAGGSTKRLFETIEKTGIDLKKVLEGKVVAGSSAGAHLIANWHYGHTAKQVNPGLGLLPIAVFTHYRPAEGTYFYKPEDLVRKIEKELKQAGLKVYFLKEQQSVVVKPKVQDETGL